MHSHLHTWRRVANVVLLCVVLVCYVADGLEAIRANSNSSDYDQRSYLGLAIDIQDGDALTDGNRHPLYPAFLAPFAARKWSFFTWAKLLSLGLGLLTLLLFYWLIRRRTGTEVALVTVLLLSRNAAFIHATSHVVCEALLVPLFAIAWYLADLSLDCSPGQSKRRTHLMAAAGATTGFVYLTKGTGQLLAMAFVPIALWIYRRHLREAWRSLLAYGLGYGLVAAPLWLYSWKEYGSPFYNYNTTHTFWFEAWEDKYATSALPTWQSYLRTHSLGEIVARQWQGMGTVLPIWCDAVVPDTTALVLLGAAGLLLVTGILAARDVQGKGEHAVDRPLRFWRPSLLYDAVLIGLHYLLFAWYAQVYVAARFFLPLTPILLWYAAAGFLAGTQWLGAHIALKRRAVEGATLGISLISTLALGIGLTTHSLPTIRTANIDPFALDKEHNVASDEMFTWIKRNLAMEWMHRNTSVDLLWGPSTTLGSWRYEARNDFYEIPSDYTSWEQLTAFVAEEELDYALIDADTVERRTALLSPFSEADGELVDIVQVPAGWALTYAEPGLPCRWCLFQILDREPIEQPASLTFGANIRLLGYDVIESVVDREGRLHFTLYWQASAPVAQDYAVHTRVLDANAVVLDESQAAPLQGQVPTSRWLPGAIYSDRHEVTVPADAPYGAAQIEVSLVAADTGEPLPIADGTGQPLVDRRWTLPMTITIGPP